MLHEDYLFRPLYMMLDEITSSFSVIKVERIKSLESYLNGLYLKYLKENRNYFLEKDITHFIDDKTITDDELTVLAELFYRDGLLKTDSKTRKILLLKSETLLKHIHEKGTTFSMERATKINEIKKELERIG